jgi:hypothetical protein
MQSPRVQIGIHADDPNWYSFSRNSRLPRNYFHRSGPICWVGVGDALAVLLAVAVLAAALCGWIPNP